MFLVHFPKYRRFLVYQTFQMCVGFFQQGIFLSYFIDLAFFLLQNFVQIIKLLAHHNNYVKVIFFCCGVCFFDCSRRGLVLESRWSLLTISLSTAEVCTLRELRQAFSLFWLKCLIKSTSLSLSRWLFIHYFNFQLNPFSFQT